MRRIAGLVTLVLGMSGGLLVQAQGAAAGVTGLHVGEVWNLAEEFRVSPDQANPNPDSLGNDEVWYFAGLRQGDPRLLREFVPDALDIVGLEQWQGPILGESEKDKLPAVGINATGQTQTPGTITWPDGAVRVHPWAGAPVVVGWRSTFDGAVDLNVMLLDMDGNGGNGALWGVRLNDLPLAEGFFADGGGGGFGGLVFVQDGDFISVFVRAFRGDDANDSTQLDFTLERVQLESAG